LGNSNAAARSFVSRKQGWPPVGDLISVALSRGVRLRVADPVVMSSGHGCERLSHGQPFPGRELLD
jgi:hypothetical protein